MNVSAPEFPPGLGLGSQSHRDFHFLDVRCWCWNNVSMDPHAFDVELNCFSHELTRLIPRRCGGNAPGKIRNVGAKARRCRLKENGVPAHFSSACFSIDLSDFGSKSAEG